MNKNCDNCYWKGYKDMHCINKKDKPMDNMCEEHNYLCCECNSKSEYKYNDKYYCEKCLLNDFDVTEYTTTHYCIDGEYLGSEDDMGEVMSYLDEGIERVD